MTALKISKGLDIPIKGAPAPGLQDLQVDGRESRPKYFSLNFDPFVHVKPRLLVKAGEVVKKGAPVVEDKATPGRMFVAPVSGVVKEVRRGLKRRLLDVVIEASENEPPHKFEPLLAESAERDQLISRLLEGGIFAHIRRRPFDRLANPSNTPRAIFVRAVETAPFAPPAEMQVEGKEEAFTEGLKALTKLTEGAVHLVCKNDSALLSFGDIAGVTSHAVEGPHPAGLSSTHIHFIDPIRNVDDSVWTLSALDVVILGHLLLTGEYLTERVVSVAGPGVIEGRTGYFRIQAGYPVEELIAGRVTGEHPRFVSGDLLTGKKVEATDFLGFYHTQLAVIPETEQREMLHFFRLGSDKYTASKTYLSGFLGEEGREYDFNTSNHGEHRGFIISKMYDKVMPMNIPTMQLMKALQGEDFDLAEELGLLEVAPEDFALATFVCPSKQEMCEITRQGLADYAAEVL